MSEANSQTQFTLDNPDGLYDPSANAYSHIAVVSENAQLVFIAGQVGDTPKGNFETQVRQIFANLRTLLKQRVATFVILRS